MLLREEVWVEAAAVPDDGRREGVIEPRGRRAGMRERWGPRALELFAYPENLLCSH